MSSTSTIAIVRALKVAQHLHISDDPIGPNQDLSVVPSSADASDIDSVLLTEYSNGLCKITLNRPNTLNSLTIDMFKKLRHILREYENNPTVQAVVIVGAGDRAFCAGGDLKEFVATGEKFIRLEYPMDRQIFRMTKPFIAIWDGYVMGGGSGVSSFGSRRICTERVQWAMPEVTVGLFPDVGSSYLFARMPGKIGLYLGMSGERINAADCLYTGLATNFVSSKKIAEFLSKLSTADLSEGRNAVDNVIREFESQCTLPSPMRTLQPQIDRLFDAPSVERIFQQLRDDGSNFAIETLQLLRKKCPFSLKVVREQYYRAFGKSIEDVLRMEFRLAIRIHSRADLKEGVRARLVDKDNNPRFNPATVEEVPDTAVDMIFWPFADPKFELEFD